MTVHLTPERCAAVYECLKQFKPFNRWKLPSAADVVFRTPARRDCMAEHVHAPGDAKQHIITMSTFKIGHFDTLVRTMAHEMIHVAQAANGQRTRSEHNADFHRRARIVAKHNGWDPKEL
jgi:hypothetical protein